MYKVYFKDGEIFKGGNYKDSKWNDMPHKPIVKIKYTLVNKTLVLEGFDGYNHLVEKVQFVNKTGRKITRILLLGRVGGMVTRIIYDFQKNKVIQDSRLMGNEYNYKPTSGWKLGVTTLKPRVTVL